MWSIDLTDLLLFSGSNADVTIESNDDILQLTAADTIFVDVKVREEGNDVYLWLKTRKMEAYHGYLLKHLYVLNPQILSFITEEDLKEWPFGEPAKKAFMTEIENMKKK
jgi:hypothetical protein